MTFDVRKMTFQTQRSSKKSAPSQRKMTFVTFGDLFPYPHTCARALRTCEVWTTGEKGQKVTKGHSRRYQGMTVMNEQLDELAIDWGMVAGAAQIAWRDVTGRDHDLSTAPPWMLEAWDEAGRAAVLEYLRQKAAIRSVQP